MRYFSISYQQMLHFLAAGLFLMSCAPKSVPTRSDTVGTFKDDVSPFRPKYEITASAAGAGNGGTPVNRPANLIPTGDITVKLNEVIDTISVRNRSIRFAQGYRVQIYTGNSREEAIRARDRSYNKFPDITPHMDYAQPAFRVRVGDFIDRLEAQRVYAGLVAEFPNALIVPDRIEIR